MTNIMKVSVAGTSLKESEKNRIIRIIVQEKQPSGN